MKTKSMYVLGLAVLLIGITGCKKDIAAKSDSSGEVAKVVEKAPVGKESVVTFVEPSKATVDASKKYVAVIKTSKGTITLDLDPKAAPLGVTNFKQLADGEFYKGLTFHRVEPGFVIQGGDPDGTGSGGPGYTIPAEIGLKHTKGALAWARLSDQVNPKQRSSGSQFYITLEATPFLDGAYSVFGYVTEGMDVVQKIAVGDKIESVVVTEK